ncbi:MAG: LamG domain-containing protein [Gammaproteobacteria bacterium]|nr:LamG domain-containing protein [Gammaproteobacteria bacterium]
MTQAMRCFLSCFALFALPAAVSAQSCDAYYTFDSDLSDMSGNGNHGQMIGPAGVPAQPSFATGRSGQALALDGSTSMRAFLDLSRDNCPAVTISAWVQLGEPVKKGTNHILSTGSGGGPRISLLSDFLVLAGPANGMREENAVRRNAGWVFIAGVYDHQGLTYRLHWRNRSKEGKLRPEAREPEDAIWVGAFNDKRTGQDGGGLLVDDLRITSRALTVAELRDLASSGPPAQAVAAASPSQPAAGQSCTTTANCGAGEYCAVDNTCHPESHLPKPASSASSPYPVGTMPGDMGDASAVERSVDDYSPTAGPVPINQAPSDSGEAISQSVDDYQVQNRFDADAPMPESEPEPAAEESGMTVGEALRLPIQMLGPRGDVRDCTSFAEITADIATNLRDKAVDVATAAACPFLDRPVTQTQAALEGADISNPALARFQQLLLGETLANCETTAQAFATLPDRALSFWNDRIASGGWATIGPRGLLLGNREQGNLIVPGDRKFITIMPPLYKDRATLTLEERDGRARVTARVCKVSFDNEYTLLRTFSVNEAPGERENQNQLILWDLDGVLLHHLIVVLDASGTIGRNFRYYLTIE